MDKKKSKVYYRLLRSLGQLFNMVRLYAPEHRMVKERSQQVFAEVNRLISEEQSLIFSEAGKVFLINGEEVEVGDDRIMRLFVDNFHSLQLGSLELKSGLNPEEFDVFIRLLSRTEHLQGEKQIKEHLKQKGAAHILPLFATYKLVKENEEIVKEGGALNLDNLPTDVIERFSQDLNKGEVSSGLKKEEKTYRFLAHEPAFLSQYGFDLLKGKGGYDELKRILWLIGDYLIGEISSVKTERVNRKILDELKTRLLSSCEQREDTEYCKREVHDALAKITAAMELKGLISLYKKHKKGLEAAAKKVKEILETLPLESQLYRKTKEDLEKIGAPRLDVTIFENKERRPACG